MSDKQYANLMVDLACNHIAMNREESIYSVAGQALSELQSTAIEKLITNQEN